MPTPLSYGDVYKNLDGLTALATAAATPLRRQKDEKDTAFVKRIVATYIALASQTGVHIDQRPQCRDTASCDRHGTCVYLGCPHYRKATP